MTSLSELHALEHNNLQLAGYHLPSRRKNLNKSIDSRPDSLEKNQKQNFHRKVRF